MKKSMLFSLIALSIAVLSGCATQTKVDRHVSGSEDGALIRFMETLAEKSSSDRAVFESAFLASVNRDADELSIAKVRSIEDIRSMSAKDQLALVKKLAADQSFKDSLSLSEDTVRLAGKEALTAQDVHQVSTAEVPNIVRDMGPNISDEAMNELGKDIETRTGVHLLGPKCKSLQDPEAKGTLRRVVRGTHDDVVAGKVKKPEEIAGDVDERLSEETGVNRRIARNRRCTLAQPKEDAGGCGVLAPAMYVGCDD